MGLTASQVKAKRKPGRYGDGNGLYLNVSKGLTKSWVLRVVVDGKRRDVGLGSCKTVPLAEVRRKVMEFKAEIAAGRDPLAERKPAKIPEPTTPTFEQLARKFHQVHGARWTSEKNRKVWLQRAERYLFPVIGTAPIHTIQRGQLLDLLIPISQSKPETGRRLKIILRQTFDFAIAYGHVESNPVDGMRAALPRSPRPKHFKALHYSQVTHALSVVDNGPSSLNTKLAFRFLILTATRSAETRGAKWDEIDFDNSVWTIPEERVKSRRKFRIPLSSGALPVLEQARGLSWDSEYIFPTLHDSHKPLSENALSLMLRKRGIPATAHGFRSSFRNWAGECSGASWAVAELCLGHSVGNETERAYFRTDLLEQRRELMEAWAAFLRSGESDT